MREERFSIMDPNRTTTIVEQRVIEEASSYEDLTVCKNLEGADSLLNRCFALARGIEENVAGSEAANLHHRSYSEKGLATNACDLAASITQGLSELNDLLVSLRADLGWLECNAPKDATDKTVGERP